MSSMDIDKPLDEIIAAKPRARRGRGRASTSRTEGRAPAAAATSGGGARARYSGAAPKSAGQASKAAAASGPKGGAVKPFTTDAIKIIISNLPADVTEAAVRDLMQSTVGPVRTVQMSYTASGKSTGTATVLFKNKGDANKAHGAYHNRMIDNQRPMKVEIAIDPNAIQSLAARVAPVPAATTAPRNTARRGGARPRPARPVKKSAEELDADMAAYKSTTAA